MTEEEILRTCGSEQRPVPHAAGGGQGGDSRRDSCDEHLPQLLAQPLKYYCPELFHFEFRI